MSKTLGQSDFEDLSAYFDGQLDADRTAAVGELIRTDPVWQGEWDQLQAIDRVLDTCDIPAAPSDLDDRILEFVRTRARRRKVLRWVWPLAGAAAAAAIIIVATVLNGPGTPTQPELPIAGKPDAAEVERAIIEHLDFVLDLNVLENYETLEAIERIELANR